MKPRIKMHDMPGDIPKQAKIAMLEGKDPDKSKCKSYKNMLQMRERATLNRQTDREVLEGLSTWESIPVGTKVSLEVKFAQKTSRIVGILRLVRDGEAYVDTPLGTFVGQGESMEEEG